MYGGEEADGEPLQLAEISKEEEEEEEEEEEDEEGEVGEYEGSWLTKTEKLCSEGEGGKVSSDSLSKVMISLQWTWSG